MKIISKQLLAVAVMMCLISGSQSAFGQGIAFYEGTFDQALDEAKKLDKLIFVDAYAAWCGPCKRMSRNVFPQKEAGDFFNENFLNMKIDCEKGFGRNFASTYKVGAYPTLLFLDHTGAVVHKIKGARDVKSLIKEGGKALAGGPSMITTLMKKYESGDRSASFLFDYVNALSSSDKDYDLPFGEYLATQSNEQKAEPKNLDLIFKLTRNVLSPGYIYLMQLENEVIARRSEDSYQEKIIEISANSTKIAAKDSDEVLFQNAQSLLKEKNVPEFLRHQYIGAISYYEITKNWKRYYKVSTKYVKTYAMENHFELNKFAWAFYQNLEGKKYLKKAIGWSSKSIQLEDNYRNNNTYAYLLFKSGKYDLAKEAADKAVLKGKEERVNYRKTQNLLKNIKNQSESVSNK